MSDDKIINFHNKRAEAAGIQPEIGTVIEQLNQRFGIRIAMDDPRLERFKSLYPILDAAAKQTHSIQLDVADDALRETFVKGVDVGRAQMMTDLIVCILEEDGLLERR